ncbi:CHAT domain-containing protein [Aureispira anguillae]|uniref:CHAT domain-containing protein n=1 Tax=Aureispira anguillae TaxID=2864201 RepID=A0A916DTY6_9BACT|nr:CHAT domain-containing tetratricopeptide repeat protein [Aureispira anguillae]BDS12207.1 CHAT domain-containing protein [Aureispira anguillae]
MRSSLLCLICLLWLDVSFAQLPDSVLNRVSEIDSLFYWYETRGQFVKGLKLAEQLVEETEDENVAAYVHALFFLVNFQEQNSLYQEAEKTCHKLLDVIEKEEGKESTVYAQTLLLSGKISSFSGQLQRAERQVLEAYNIIKKIMGTNNPYYTNALTLLGLVYMDNDKLVEATKALVKAKENHLKLAGKMNETYTSIISYLTILYERQEQIPEAIATALEALEIQEKVGGKDLIYTHRLSEVARLYYKHGKPDLAETLAAEVLELCKNIVGYRNRFTLRAIVLNGNVKYAQQDYLEGLADAKMTLSLNSLDPAHSMDTTTWESLFKSLTEVDFFLSFDVLEESFKLVELFFKKLYEKTKDKEWLRLQYILYQTQNEINNKVRNSFRTEGDKLQLIQQNASLAQKGVMTALELDCEDCLEGAFLLAQENKSRLLDEAIRMNEAKKIGYLPDHLEEKEQKLQEELAQIKGKLAAVSPEDTTYNILIAEFNEINQTIAEFQRDLEQAYPKYYNAKYNNKLLSLEQIQKDLKKDQLLLDYLVTPSKMYVFVISWETIEVKEIGIDQDQLLAQVERLRLAISDYDFFSEDRDYAYREYCKVAHWFYQMLIKDIIPPNSNSIQQLIIIPDGKLGYLPFDVFLTEALDNQAKKAYNQLPYLLNFYQISYNYSVSLWWKNQNSTTVSNNGHLLAYAPSYSNELNDEQLKKIDSERLLTIRKKLTPLSQCIEEVTGLSKFFEGEFRTKRAATEANFKQDIGHYDIIHLAMHGVLDKEEPLLSSLAFTEIGDSLEDNFLQAYEISQMDINAQLVVLSACETGFGKFEQGEGVMSLARSFMYAGVPSLVVSLWQINDLSTAIIMQHFYGGLAKGLNKSLALKEAKQKYLAGTKGLASHPIFWASFIQLGDDRPVLLYTKRNKVWWSIFGGGIGLLGLLLLFRIFRKRREK